MNRMQCSFVRRARRGAVLLLVLGAVVILSLIAVELAHRANVDISRSSRASREAAFRRGIDSGIEIAKAKLAEGRVNTKCDSLDEPWNKPVEFVPNSMEKLSIRIADEAGKINILLTLGTDAGAEKTRKSLARLFAFLKKAEPKRAEKWTVVEAAVQDRLNAAAPFAAVNQSATHSSPIFTLDGLRESGVALEMVYGDASHETGKDPWVLADVLTTFGDGRVNLNTAPAPVLYALDEEFDDALVNSIEQWRGSVVVEGQTSGQPFENAKALEQVNGIVETSIVNGVSQITKNLFLKVQDRVTVQGRIFSVRVEVSVGEHRRVAYGFLAASNSVLSEFKVLGLEEIEP